MRKGHVVAVAPDPADVEPILTHLHQMGLPAASSTPPPGRYPLEDPTFRERIVAVRRGLGVGWLIAAAVGVILVLAVPGLRDLGIVARIVVVFGISLQGTIPGIMWLTGRADHYDDDPAVNVEVGPEDRLIVVDALHDEPRARHILETYGARAIDEEEPLDDAAHRAAA